MNETAESDSLRTKLQAWRVAPPADPGFRSGVWARIEAGRRAVADTWSGYLRRHAVVWSAVLLASACGAAWHGQSVGQKHTRAENDAILASYVAQIDARAMHP